MIEGLERKERKACKGGVSVRPAQPQVTPRHPRSVHPCPSWNKTPPKAEFRRLPGLTTRQRRIPGGHGPWTGLSVLLSRPVCGVPLISRLRRQPVRQKNPNAITNGDIPLPPVVFTRDAGHSQDPPSEPETSKAPRPPKRA